MPNLMPTLFFGHGNPMNALLRNRYTEAWTEIGVDVPTPKAILCISAHWYVSGAALTVNTAPRTIHDFGGFPRELYQVNYPAPGRSGLGAPCTASPLSFTGRSFRAVGPRSWDMVRSASCLPGGGYSRRAVEHRRTRAAPFHYEIGQTLAPLREEGVLIAGSGNLVHNLHAYAWGGHPVEAYPWAISFEERVRQMLVAGEHRPLVGYERLGRDALLSIPTPDHYLPMLYVIGAGAPGEAVTFPVDGVDGGSISMLTVRLG